jgi:branched-subunit amino acid transport protein
VSGPTHDTIVVGGRVACAATALLLSAVVAWRTRRLGLTVLVGTAAVALVQLVS